MATPIQYPVKYDRAENNINEAKATKQIITAEHWNELFNILAEQGNKQDIAISALYKYLMDPTVGITDPSVSNVIGAINNFLSTLSSSKEDKSSADQLLNNVTYNSATGVFSFQKRSGSTISIDTNIEKIPASVKLWYGTKEDPETHQQVTTWWFVLTDSAVPPVETYCRVDNMFKPYTFNDTSEIDFSTVDSGNSNIVTAALKAGSVAESKLTSELQYKIDNNILETLAYKNAAEAAANLAGRWAVSNEVVDPAQGLYSSKHYAESASSSAQDAAESEANAAESESAASTSESLALDYAKKSEGFAKGTENGTPVPLYENDNSKYYKEQAEFAAEVAQEAAASVSNPVSYDAQTKTTSEKKQARTNIRAEEIGKVTIGNVEYIIDAPVTTDPGHGTAGHITIVVG